MRLSDLSSSEIDARVERHIVASIRHTDASKRHTVATKKLFAEIQKRKGVESIDSKINRLSEMQQIFVKALLDSPEHRMTVFEIEKKVWNTKEGECVESETRRKFLQRLEKAISEHAIPLLIEPLKRPNRDIYGYEIIELTKQKKKN
jgi:hypothetical protein